MELEGLKELLDNLRQQIKEDMENQKREILDELIIENKSRVEALDNRVEVVEKTQRRKNVVLYGVEEEFASYWDMEKYVCQFMNDNLKLQIVDTDFDFITRAGKPAAGKKRPIIMTLVAFRNKLKILGSAKLLKGTPFRVVEDFPKEVRDRRKLLLQPMLEARKQGKFAILKYDQLVVKEKRLTSTDEDALRNKRGLSKTPEGKEQERVKEDSQTLKKHKVWSSLHKYQFKPSHSDASSSKNSTLPKKPNDI